LPSHGPVFCGPISHKVVDAMFCRFCFRQDVSLSGDALPNGRTRENRAEIITDAVLSQGRHRELERELKPWKPDEETPENLNLSFSNSWRSVDNSLVQIDGGLQYEEFIILAEII